MNLNLNNLAYLVDDTLTTAKCAFGLSDRSESYNYVVKKELAKDLEPGDLVVVQRMTPGNCGMTVVRVQEIHNESEVDPDSEQEYFWIIDKVSGRVEFLVEEHAERVQKLKEMRRTSYRKRLIEEYKNGSLLENDA